MADRRGSHWRRLECVLLCCMMQICSGWETQMAQLQCRQGKPTFWRHGVSQKLLMPQHEQVLVKGAVHDFSFPHQHLVFWHLFTIILFLPLSAEGGLPGLNQSILLHKLQNVMRVSFKKIKNRWQVLMCFFTEAAPANGCSMPSAECWAYIRGQQFDLNCVISWRQAFALSASDEALSSLWPCTHRGE